MIRRALPVLLLLAACGERTAPDRSGDIEDLDGFESGAPDVRGAATTAIGRAVPVRIGEAGPAFRACSSAGTPLRDAPLVVREGPSDSAAAVDSIPPGTRAFVCTRSMDQRWMGVVYEAGGALSSACGVSAPVPAERDYAGACRSGWVTSAAVRSVAG